MSFNAGVRLQFGDYALPPGVDLLYRGGEVVPLEPRATGVLRYLVENHDRVVSKDELLASVWADVFTTDGVLKKAVSQIRRALADDADQPVFVATYHGRGYRFIAAVRRTAAGPKLDAPAHQDGPLVPNFDRLAGRDNELLALRAELRSAMEGRPRPVVIVGDAGMGKTQLIRHFSRGAIEQGAVALYARFSDYPAADGAPFQRFVDVLHAALGCPREDLREAVRLRCGVRLPAELFASEGNESASGEADLLRLVVPITRALLALGRATPTLLVFDDVQWADDASLQVIGSLMRSLDSEPLMLVVLVRAADADDRAHPVRAWLEAHAAERAYTTLRLDALDEARCREVIGAIFGIRRNAEIPRNDIGRLVHLTDGNPYFLVETLRLLVGAGAVAPDAARGRWLWKGFRDLALPATIVTAARARVDRIDAEVRALIEHAAVLGDEFRVETLCRLTERKETDVERILSEAVRCGILSIHGLASGEDCRFHHTIVRQVVYDGIPPFRRRAMHRRAADALEAVYCSERERICEALATHYAAAGDARRAFETALEAWRIARQRSEWQKAATLLERMREAAGQLGSGITEPEQLDLLLAIGETWRATGRGREAAAIIDRAVSLAASLREIERLGRALMLRGAIEGGMSDYAAARASFVQAVEHFLESGSEAGVAHAVLQLAAIETATGNYERAIALVRDLRAGDPPEDLAARAKTILGWALALRGDYEEGRALLEEALAWNEAAGDILERALVLRRLHWVQLSRGEYEAAIRLAVRAREDSVAAGDADGEARANMGIGQARLAQGLHEESVSFLTRALGQVRATGNAHTEAECLWLLGRARFELGAFDEAAARLDRALVMVRKIGDRDDEFRILIDVARVQLARGDLRAAEESARTAQRIAASLNNAAGAALAAMELAAIDLRRGDVTPATRTVRDAAQILEQTQSSERLRAWLVRGQVEHLAGDYAEAGALRDRAANFVDAMRNQIDPDDTARRRAVTRSAERMAERWSGQ